MIIDEIMKMNISTLISEYLKGQLDPPVCDVTFFNQEGQLDLQGLSSPSWAPQARSEKLKKKPKMYPPNDPILGLAGHRLALT